MKKFFFTFYMLSLVLLVNIWAQPTRQWGKHPGKSSHPGYGSHPGRHWGGKHPGKSSHPGYGSHPGRHLGGKHPGKSSHPGYGSHPGRHLGNQDIRTNEDSSVFGEQESSKSRNLTSPKTKNSTVSPK